MNEFSAQGFYKLGAEIQTLFRVAKDISKERPEEMVDEGVIKAVMPCLENALDLAGPAVKKQIQFAQNSKAHKKQASKPYSFA